MYAPEGRSHPNWLRPEEYQRQRAHKSFADDEAQASPSRVERSRVEDWSKNSRVLFVHFAQAAADDVASCELDGRILPCTVLACARMRVCEGGCMYVCMPVCYVRRYGGISCESTYSCVLCVSSMGSKASYTRPQQEKGQDRWSSQLQSRDWVNAGAEEWRVRREDGEKRQMVGRNGKVFPQPRQKRRSD